MLLATASIVFFNANAGVNGIEVAQKGDMDLGLMIGIPPTKNAKLPTVSLDASWVLTSGFIDTNTFGENGAVDLGFYYGFTPYGEESGHITQKTFQNCMLARSAFHFQFVKNLDTYLGILTGINLWSWSWEDENSNQDNSGTDTKGVFGAYTGAKYYFSEKFAVKMEFADDFIEGNIPSIAMGVSFKF